MAIFSDIETLELRLHRDSFDLDGSFVFLDQELEDFLFLGSEFKVFAPG